MAKNFPYFKFIATEWLTGNIVFEPLNVQGLFINICAIYWQRDGELTVTEINKRYKNPPEMDALKDHFLKIDGDKITIGFLDEQLVSADHISKINSQNGSLGGRPKHQQNKETKPTAKRIKANDTEPKQRKEEIKKNKNKRKEEINKRHFVLGEQMVLDTTPLEYAVNNFPLVIEKHLMNFGQGKVSMDRFKENFDKQYPAGISFENDRHIQNTIKKSIQVLAENKIKETGKIDQNVGVNDF